MRKAILLFSVVALLAGCDQPTIDASNNETLKSSIAKARSSLPTERRADFDNAIQVLALSQLDLKTILASGSASGDVALSKMAEPLAGKNAEQVIQEADRVLAERKQKEREQALAEIKELEEKRQAAERAKAELSNVVVSRSRFYKRKDRYRDEPIIEITVKNGTSSAISRAYFEAVLASPNRSVPWLKERFNYRISGGLEPGEQQSWTLAPNSFSEWGKVEAPADAVLTVTTVRVDGPNEKPLFSSDGFGEREASRLAELQNKFGIQ